MEEGYYWVKDKQTHRFEIARHFPQYACWIHFRGELLAENIIEEFYEIIEKVKDPEHVSQRSSNS